MSVAAIYPHIVKNEGNPARLKNNPRVRVAQIVMDYHKYGWSAEQFCEHYPHLRPAEVHAALTFYYDHQRELDDEIQAELDEVAKMEAQGHKSPIAQKLKEKGLI